MDDRRTDVHDMDEALKLGMKQRRAAAAKGQALPDGAYPIRNREELLNAIQLRNNSKHDSKARIKAHIIKRAKALGLTNLLPDEWKPKSDRAGLGLIDCPEDDCMRVFATVEGLEDHAVAVHTFSDIQHAVSDEIRSLYGEPSESPTPGTFTWVVEISSDWVVFEVERGPASTLYMASYSFLDGKVTIGDLTEVVRRTGFVPVADGKTDGTP